MLVTCRTLLKEVEDVLHRPHIKEKYGLTSEAIRDLLRLLKDETEGVRIARKLPVAIRDPKDEKVLACVLGGRAQYLVTGDEDLLVLDGHPALGAVWILRVHEFLTTVTTPGDRPEAQEN